MQLPFAIKQVRFMDTWNCSTAGIETGFAVGTSWLHIL